MSSHEHTTLDNEILKVLSSEAFRDSGASFSQIKQVLKSKGIKVHDGSLSNALKRLIREKKIIKETKPKIVYKVADPMTTLGKLLVLDKFRDNFSFGASSIIAYVSKPEVTGKAINQLISTYILVSLQDAIYKLSMFDEEYAREFTDEYGNIRKEKIPTVMIALWLASSRNPEKDIKEIERLFEENPSLLNMISTLLPKAGVLISLLKNVFNEAINLARAFARHNIRWPTIALGIMNYDDIIELRSSEINKVVLDIMIYSLTDILSMIRKD